MERNSSADEIGGTHRIYGNITEAYDASYGLTRTVNGTAVITDLEYTVIMIGDLTMTTAVLGSPATVEFNDTRTGMAVIGDLELNGTLKEGTILFIGADEYEAVGGDVTFDLSAVGGDVNITKIGGSGDLQKNGVILN
jgi:hypothetical protein